MSTTLKKKLARRERIRKGIRSKIVGTAERPRLAVYRSTSQIYAQIIDDSEGKTLASASTLSPEMKDSKGTGVELAQAVGKLVAEKAKAAGVSSVVFDRGGLLFHGRIKALAESARENGLAF